MIVPIYTNCALVYLGKLFTSWQNGPQHKHYFTRLDLTIFHLSGNRVHISKAYFDDLNEGDPPISIVIKIYLG